MSSRSLLQRRSTGVGGSSAREATDGSLHPHTAPIVAGHGPHHLIGPVSGHREAGRNVGELCCLRFLACIPLEAHPSREDRFPACRPASLVGVLRTIPKQFSTHVSGSFLHAKRVMASRPRPGVHLLTSYEAGIHGARQCRCVHLASNGQITLRLSRYNSCDGHHMPSEACPSHPRCRRVKSKKRGQI